MSDLFKDYYSKFKFNEAKQKLDICIIDKKNIDKRNIDDINLNVVEI